MQRKLVTWILVFALVAAPFLGLVPATQGDASSWTYYKILTIAQTAGAGSNYTLRLTIQYGSGSDSGSTVYCNSNCQADFDDIRFEDQYGTNLGYWIETKTDSSSAIVYVRVPDDLDSVDSEITFRYGNPSASSESNPYAVGFLLFDHFTTDPFNASLWTEWDQGWSIVVAEDAGNSRFYTRKQDIDYVGISAGIYNGTSRSGNVSLGFTYYRDVAGWEGNEIFQDGFTHDYLETNAYGSDDFLGFQSYVTTYSDHKLWNAISGDGGSFSSTAADLPSESVWYRMRIDWYNGDSERAQFWRDETSLANVTDAAKVPESAYVYFYQWSGYGGDTTYVFYDYAFLRKFVYPEPAITSGGQKYYGGSETVPFFPAIHISTNTTAPWKLCNFTAKAIDESGAYLSGWLFSSNVTGAWANTSYTSLGGSATTAWVNYTTRLLPTFGDTVSYRFYARNTDDDWGASAQFNLTLDAYPDALVTYLKTKALALNWTEDIETAYCGYSLGAVTFDELQAKYDALPAEDWDDATLILYWSANLRKLGVVNETLERAALDAAVMYNGLPKTGEDSPSTSGLDYFAVHSRYALQGYGLAEEYEYLTDKWNLTAAFDFFNSSVYDYGEPLLLIEENGDEWGINYGPRFYDEGAETVDAYLTFYDLGIDAALNEAVYWWNMTNDLNWNETESHYWYALDGSWNGYECEGGAFIEIGWKLWQRTNGTAPYLDRLETDLYTRLIGSEWASPAWQYDGNPVNRRYAMFHYTRDTYGPDRNVFQIRLPESIESWAAIMGFYGELNETGKGYVQNMIESPAWDDILDHSALYNGTMFRQFTDDAGPTNLATAIATAWLLNFAMSPQTATLAVPYEEIAYPTKYIMIDGDLFSFGFENRTFDLTIMVGGIVQFLFNNPVNQTFSMSGHYRVTFSSDWNEITSVVRMGEVPTNGRVYYCMPPQPQVGELQVVGGYAADSWVQFQAYATSFEGTLDAAILTWNATGSWLNISTLELTTTPQWATASIHLPEIEGLAISYYWTVNDTDGYIGVSEIASFVTTQHQYEPPPAEDPTDYTEALALIVVFFVVGLGCTLVFAANRSRRRDE